MDGQGQIRCISISKTKKIISVDCLEKNLEYMGVAGDKYLVFEANEYISDLKYFYIENTLST